MANSQVIVGVVVLILLLVIVAQYRDRCTLKRNVAGRYYRSLHPPMDGFIPPAEWGPNAWDHYYTVAGGYDPARREQYRAYFNLIPFVLRCAECGENFAALLKKRPIDGYLESRESLLEWLWRQHLDVRKHQKVKTIPDFSLEDVYKRYLPTTFQPAETAPAVDANHPASHPASRETFVARPPWFPPSGMAISSTSAGTSTGASVVSVPVQDDATAAAITLFATPGGHMRGQTYAPTVIRTSKPVAQTIDGKVVRTNEIVVEPSTITAGGGGIRANTHVNAQHSAVALFAYSGPTIANPNGDSSYKPPNAAAAGGVKRCCKGRSQMNTGVGIQFAV